MYGFYRYRPKRPILSASEGVGKMLLFLTHPDNLGKKAQQTQLRRLPCSNACVFINKQTKMNHGARVGRRRRNKNIIINQIN